MTEFFRDRKRLMLTAAGAAAVFALGYAIPHAIWGSRATDGMVTGSLAAAVAMPVPGGAATEPPAVPATPANLVSLEVSALVTTAEPAENAADHGSADFVAGLEVLRGGDPARAYELATLLPDSGERRALEWTAIRLGNGRVDYRSVLGFIKDAPAFGDTDLLRVRLEQALLRADAPGAEIIRVLGGAMPQTVEAQIALALAYRSDGQTKRATGIAQAVWHNYELTQAQEAAALNRLGSLLTADDHWTRAVNLMMHDRAKGVERLMDFLTEPQQSLAIARNAVSRNAKDAKKLLDAVDASMQQHPVYLFSRAQRARQFELWDDAVSWLNKAKGELPESAEWWYERRALTRQLLALDEYDLAYRAAAGYGDGPDGRVVDANFHAGWIALSFLDKPADAVGHFERMAAHATLPDTVTQANYWLGRARRAAGDIEGAKTAFATAARYNTVYYGQLASEELGEPVAVRELPEVDASGAAFEANDVVKAVRLLAANGETGEATALLRGFAAGLDNGGELLLAARLAEELHAVDLAILIAETAEGKGFPLDPISFPDDRVPTTMVAEIDHAAIFAITRQESRFRLDAISSAGARGLMQLMPATAAETAQKVGVEYSKQRLITDGAYNALLGSTYLAAQLDRFDNSLVLAAAAYNAGPGNVRKWLKAFGDPRDSAVDPVDWIERIPLLETRKYVQRVLGNYLFYRARLGHAELGARDALRRIES